VTTLAEAGCTVPEIASVTGHSQKHAQAILNKYLARTRHLADAAIPATEGGVQNFRCFDLGWRRTRSLEP